MRGLRTLLIVAYLVVGVIVAANEDYLRNLGNLRRIVSAFLAIILWPLVLLGVDLQLRD